MVDDDNSFRDQPDLVILDLMLPHLDGLGVLQGLGATSDVPTMCWSNHFHSVNWKQRSVHCCDDVN